MRTLLRSMVFAGVATVVALGVRGPLLAGAAAQVPAGAHRVSAAGPAVDSGGTQAPADAVLRRVSRAYEALTTLQADFVQHVDNPLLETHTTSTGTLYSRRPGRLLLRFSRPKGDVVVSDGHYIWAYYPSVNPNQVLRTRGGMKGTGALDLQAQFLGDPTARFHATLEGTDTLAGRHVIVLMLLPRRPAGYQSLKVWVDRSDHLVRRFTVREENGLTRTFDLSHIRVNPALSDSLFQFQPPAGAHVVDRGGSGQ